ncbi:unnamed protein product [Prorocentrum cordatum]|uniref:Uncharacterized protein n=1 Tax=Prorocentrum cordatum TaxID=2364126 RepID=A0ABN9RR51_9DINO|nr:unnamed protein product [Polarella glacialis]
MKDMEGGAVVVAVGGRAEWPAGTAGRPGPPPRPPGAAPARLCWARALRRRLADHRVRVPYLDLGPSADLPWAGASAEESAAAPRGPSASAPPPRIPRPRARRGRAPAGAPRAPAAAAAAPAAGAAAAARPGGAAVPRGGAGAAVGLERRGHRAR